MRPTYEELEQRLARVVAAAHEAAQALLTCVQRDSSEVFAISARLTAAIAHEPSPTVNWRDLAQRLEVEQQESKRRSRQNADRAMDEIRVLRECLERHRLDQDVMELLMWNGLASPLLEVELIDQSEVPAFDCSCTDRGDTCEVWLKQRGA